MSDELLTERELAIKGRAVAMEDCAPECGYRLYCLELLTYLTSARRESETREAEQLALVGKLREALEVTRNKFAGRLRSIGVEEQTIEAATQEAGAALSLSLHRRHSGR